MSAATEPVADAPPRRPAVRGAAWRAFALGALALAACASAQKPRGDPDDPEVLVELGQRDLAANKASDALEAFDGALRRNPRLFPAIRGRIESSRRLGTLPQESAVARAQTQRTPDDGLAWYTLGLCAFAGGDEKAAVDALARASELMPKEADVHYRLGVALFDGERFAEAKGPLTRAVELSPGSARYRVPLATVLDRLGDRHGAIQTLAPIADLAPTVEEAKVAMQTSRVLTDPFRGVPQDARAQLEEGLGYLLRDAPGLAVAPLEGLLQKFPDLGAGHALLGLASARLDEAGRAVTELKRAAELSPDAPQPHLYLAELYASRARPELAQQEYEAALARDPLDVVTLRKLGALALDRPGGAAAAIPPLRRAVALEASDAPTQLLLARAELATSEAPAGVARLERLAEGRPDDAEVLLRLALALYDVRTNRTGAERRELTERAATLARKVLALQPDNAAASRLLTALQAG